MATIIISIFKNIIYYFLINVILQRPRGGCRGGIAGRARLRRARSCFPARLREFDKRGRTAPSCPGGSGNRLVPRVHIHADARGQRGKPIRGQRGKPIRGQRGKPIRGQRGKPIQPRPG